MVKMLAATLLALGALIPRASTAQRVFGFGGGEVRLGVADPKNADKGVAYAIDADLGYLKLPFLRMYAGLAGFNADADVTVAGTKVGGSIKGLGVEVGGRLDMRPLRKLSPFVLLGLSFTHVNASDVSDPTTADLIEGTNVALDYGAGLAWHLGPRHTWSVVGDLRFVTGSDVGRTVLTAGMRWSPRGREMYRREAQPKEEPVTTAATAAYSTLASTQRSLPGVASVRETDSTVTIVLDETVFDAASGGLSTLGRSTLQTTAKSLATVPNAPVRVEGYSDSTGNVQGEQRASEQRAEMVRAALIVEGVNSTRLTSGGYGATRPVGDNGTAEGRSKNRRVEVVVVKAKP